MRARVCLQGKIKKIIKPYTNYKNVYERARACVRVIVETICAPVAGPVLGGGGWGRNRDRRSAFRPVQRARQAEPFTTGRGGPSSPAAAAITRDSGASVHRAAAVVPTVVWCARPTTDRSVIKRAAFHARTRFSHVTPFYYHAVAMIHFGLFSFFRRCKRTFMRDNNNNNIFIRQLCEIRHDSVWNAFTYLLRDETRVRGHRGTLRGFSRTSVVPPPLRNVIITVHHVNDARRVYGYYILNGITSVRNVRM